MGAAGVSMRQALDVLRGQRKEEAIDIKQAIQSGGY
jgi:hypothetical protein